MATASQTALQARTVKSTAVRSRPVARLVWAMSGLNLALVVGLLVLVFVVSERWWLGTLATYLPRAPWAAPSLVLSLVAVFWHRPSLWINLIALGLVIGPLMDVRAPGLTRSLQADRRPTTHALRIVSCNVQAFRPNFAEVMREVLHFQPDIVALQEARGEHPLLAESFPDWHHLHHDYYWLASRYPLKLIASCETAAFDRVAGIIVEVDAPGGPIIVANIHQMTARRGLLAVTKRSLITGEAAADIADFQVLRNAEAGELRESLDRQISGQPVIVLGDFNTPTSSSLLQEHWGDLQSAFDAAGVGYGFTSPVKEQKYWPAYTPWARIDHILCSAEWLVKRCEIGRGNGSDHRLIAAVLAR